jgi:hypothetical protein
MKDKARIQAALDVAVGYGGIAGDHHKAWVIDQMVRRLTGCPIVEKSAVDAHGNRYTFDALGESEAYKSLVAAACDGEFGPNTYEWEVGIAP